MGTLALVRCCRKDMVFGTTQVLDSNHASATYYLGNIDSRQVTYLSKPLFPHQSKLGVNNNNPVRLFFI